MQPSTTFTHHLCSTAALSFFFVLFLPPLFYSTDVCLFTLLVLLASITNPSGNYFKHTLRHAQQFIKIHIQHHSCAHLIALGVFNWVTFSPRLTGSGSPAVSVTPYAVARYRFSMFKRVTIYLHPRLSPVQEAARDHPCVMSEQSPRTPQGLIHCGFCIPKTIHTHSCGFYKSHPAPLRNPAMINLHFHHSRRFNFKLLPSCAQ